MLSIPSKLMESCVTGNITNHFADNKMLDKRQWAYKKGKSRKLLLIPLTEKFSIENKLVVGIVFRDFTKKY